MGNPENEQPGIEIPLDVAEEIANLVRTSKGPERASWACGYLCAYIGEKIKEAKQRAEARKGTL